MDGLSNKGFQHELLQLLRDQKETMAKMREETNSRMVDIVQSVQALRDHSKKELLLLMRDQNDAIKKQNDMMEKQNEMVKTQTKELELLSSAMKILEKNSKLDHDDDPFPCRVLERHEPGWRAAFETLMSKIKDQVDRWRNGMDSTLIFVALFVTVITAFQTPVSQNLFQNPADVTNDILRNLTMIVFEVAALNGLKVPNGLPQPEPFRPDQTDQIVTLFWYSALLLSLITAILSVFGRQWVEHLTKKPLGHLYKDKSWRLDYRLRLADKLLRPLLDSLHPILILSIILFIVGLLFQLWEISVSLGKSRLLVITSSLGSALIFGTAVVTTYTFVHGIWWEESPFTTSTSMSIRQLVFQVVRVPQATTGDIQSLFCSTVMQMVETHHVDQVSAVVLHGLLNSENINNIELATDTILAVLDSDALLKAKQTVAWNLCQSYWSISDIDLRKKSAGCLTRLYSALFLAFYDTPPAQEKARLTFLVARLIILLKCCAATMFLTDLENEQVKPIYLEVLKLYPEDWIDKELLKNAKLTALEQSVFLEIEAPSLFDDINEDKVLLSRILREDVDDSWKIFVLKYYDQENVTNILKEISKKSFGEEAYVVKILGYIIDYCKLPLIFPNDFDISALIKYSTNNVDCADTILSCLSLMDDTLLSHQQHLFEFLDSLQEVDTERPERREEIPAVSVIATRNRVALSALPFGLVESVRSASSDAGDELPLVQI